MNHSHTVPYDNVALKGFVKVDHSPISDVYLALSELSLQCKPHEILGLKLAFLESYASYGVVYTTRRSVPHPRPYLFTTSGDLLQAIHLCLKELPDGANFYLFGYQDQSVELPKGCPEPKEFEGLYPKLIAVAVKT
jgi:hypothetical protein